MGVPLAWAVLLWFHPAGERDSVYASLRDEVTAWQIVHAGTLVFIGLMGVALYVLTRELPGRAAAVSRLAVGPFVLFYGAYEAVIGLGTGALVQHANDAPPGERARGVGRDPVPPGQRHHRRPGPRRQCRRRRLGGRGDRRRRRLPRGGARVAVLVPLALSALVVSHPPPIGPIALAAFATAVGLLALTARRDRTASARVWPEGWSTPGRRRARA